MHSEIHLVLRDERHDAAMFNALNFEKLDADPCILDGIADNCPTADFAKCGQLESHVQEGADGERIIQLKERATRAEHHDPPTNGARVAAGGHDPHVNIKADLHAWKVSTAK